MRGKETWLLAAAAGLVAWALYLWSHSHALIPDILARYTEKPTAAKVTPKPSPAPARKGHSVSGRASLAQRFPAEVTTMAVPLPPFPTQQNVQTGTAVAQVRHVYGEPIMNVSELKSGHMLERWYYVNSDNTAMTVATMDDGFVSAVQTRSIVDFGIHLHPSGS